MTISEMHTAVKLGLDKTSSLTLPAFTPEEIDFWLNKAQEKFVDIITDEYKRNGLESRFYDYLAPIIMTYSGSFELTKPLNKDDKVGIVTNAVRKNIRLMYSKDSSLVDFSHTIRYILSVYVTLESNLLEDGTYGNVGSLYKCNPIKEEDSAFYLKNAFNIPYLENPVYYVTQDKGYATVTTTPIGSSWPTVSCKELVIIYSSFASSVPDVYVSAVRNPDSVSYTGNIDCILPSIVHNKIVDLAVAMMLENIESERVQTNTQFLNT